MEELRPEELEELVDELEGESDEEEALSPEVEELLRDLQQSSAWMTRLEAAERLGELGESSPRIVRSLIAAGESGPFLGVREAAMEALRVPVHQECLQQHPELTAAAESALQQDLDLRQMARSAPAQRRIYPGFRIQERPLVARIMGVLFALIGLGLPVLWGPGIAGEGNLLTMLVLAVISIAFTYAGLLAAGLDLKEFVLALLHRRAWQGQQVTAEGWITGQEIEEHYHKSDSGRGSYTYTHWITFEFSTSGGPVRLKAQVDEGRYVQLKRGQTVRVRYAQEDPRLALLEWEQD